MLSYSVSTQYEEEGQKLLAFAGEPGNEISGVSLVIKGHHSGTSNIILHSGYTDSILF